MMTVGGCAVIFDFASVARRTGPRSSDVEGFFGDRQFFVQRWGFPIASSVNVTSKVASRRGGSKTIWTVSEKVCRYSRDCTLKTESTVLQ
uniref:Uncharacterized protein n=1 Tax=Physcomitrium patens TaxID=3218 RepID=A0A2K1JTX3_PHYPA|nr:hypothetical protein PHYPA_014752 [Physcomitrium patens]